MRKARRGSRTQSAVLGAGAREDRGPSSLALSPAARGASEWLTESGRPGVDRGPRRARPGRSEAAAYGVSSGCGPQGGNPDLRHRGRPRPGRDRTGTARERERGPSSQEPRPLSPDPFDSAGFPILPALRFGSDPDSARTLIRPGLRSDPDSDPTRTWVRPGLGSDPDSDPCVTA